MMEVLQTSALPLGYAAGSTQNSCEFCVDPFHSLSPGTRALELTSSRGDVELGAGVIRGKRLDPKTEIYAG